MKTRTLAKLIVMGGAVFACLLALEIGVRLGARRDTSGNLTFRSTPLKPYHLPADRAEKIIERYLHSSDSSMLYDEELGWRPRPGVHDHNEAGFITTGRAPDQTPEPERLRIALFGGSYTEGTFKDGWWRVLEEQLNARGVRCEVLNFGVAGFAMDQAYLRWKRDGVVYHPDLVLFGFSAGNTLGNVNLIPMLENPESSIPFTKPRFVPEGDGVRLINSPTPAPDRLAAIFRDPKSWPPIAHEFFYNASDYEMKPWRASRLLAYVEGKLGRPRSLHTPLFYEMREEPATVSLAIIRRFAREATGSGSTFWIAHIPHHVELSDLRQRGAFRFTELLNAVEAAAPVIHTERELLDACGSALVEESFVDGHYNAKLHAAVGATLARYIAEHVGELRRPTAGSRPARR